jgi:hypothetical protein
MSLGFHNFRNFSDSLPSPNNPGHETYTILYNIRLHSLQSQIQFPSARPPICWILKGCDSELLCSCTSSTVRDSRKWRTQRFGDWICFRARVRGEGTYSQENGPIRHVETCPDYFFTTRVHTTKSTVKILAANTRCKYFFKNC